MSTCERFLVDLGDLIAELDVNPLAVTAAGCMALDVLVIPSAVTTARSFGSWVSSTVRLPSDDRKARFLPAHNAAVDVLDRAEVEVRHDGPGLAAAVA
jgi:hypothetical protein